MINTYINEVNVHFNSRFWVQSRGINCEQIWREAATKTTYQDTHTGQKVDHPLTREMIFWRGPEMAFKVQTVCSDNKMFYKVGKDEL